MVFIVRGSDSSAIGLLMQRPDIGTHYSAQFNSKKPPRNYAKLWNANKPLWNLISTVVDVRKLCISKTFDPDRYHVAVRTRGAGPSEWNMFFHVSALSQIEYDTIQAFSLFEVKCDV